MNNVVRVLGIVVASTVLGLAGLFLLLFTICGGMKSSEGAGVLAVCLVLIVGAIALIVFLGRGLAASRSTSRGLAVAPYGAVPISAPSNQTMPFRPLAGTDQQVLVGLRIALVLYILLSIGTMAFSVVTLREFGSGVAIHLILRNILSLLPPAAVLIAVSVRNPPAAAALDALAGMGIASILFRFGFLAFSGFASTYRQVPDLGALVLRLGAYSAIEAGLTAMAIHLRSRLGPFNPVALIVATVAFLFWDGLVQVAMQMLTTLMF